MITALLVSTGFSLGFTLASLMSRSTIKMLDSSNERLHHDYMTERGKTFALRKEITRLLENR